MAYFNHAFHKVFLGTGNSLLGQPATNPVVPGVTYTVSSDSGYVTTSGLPTYMLNVLSRNAQSSPYSGPSSLSSWQSGYFGIFSPDTNLSIRPTQCCNIYIAGSAIYANDKIGPFHGGYTETNKSKMINPRYVQEFYRVDACEPQNHVLHIGSTFWTAGGAITFISISGTATLAPNLVNELINLDGGTGTGAQVIVSTDGAGLVTNLQVVGNAGVYGGKGYTVGDVLTIPGDLGTWQLTVGAVTDANTDPVTGSGGASCCQEFLCGETYTLRIDIKGSPALRYLNHNAYYNTDAYTGCCPEGSIAPVAVNSTEVMIKWANGLINSPIVSPFLQIVIQDEAGVLWYEPGTSAADLAILGGDTWDNYPEGTAHIDGACAGLILNGAYVDTKFGDCTFQITDFYEKEPVRLYASEVDFNGDPCEFTGICVVTECQPTQANGLGEQVLRDLIMSESYRQNFLHTDLRIREITQGNQIVSAINRNALYTKYYLLHNVPRFNNPTGVFDNDRYLLEIVAETTMSAFENTINDWLRNCGTQCAFSAFECLTECSSINFPPLPVKRKVDGPDRPISM